MQATKYTVNLRQITDIQKPLTININIEGTIAGNNPITKKGASKVRGQARCFRQVINKTKKIFYPFASQSRKLFPATLLDRLHTDTNFDNKNFQQTYNEDILSSMYSVTVKCANKLAKIVLIKTRFKRDERG